MQQIDIDVLLAWGGVLKVYSKNEFIFYEGDAPHFYYQVVAGIVKMYSSNEAGRELIQGIFYEGDSFGEPPIFINETYPASAVACQESTVVKIAADSFLKILDTYPGIERKLTVAFARRIYDKAFKAKNFIMQSPEERILSFLNFYKRKEGASVQSRVLIPYKRQEIADFTALRVETVIRTLAVMHRQKKVTIVNRKLYY